MLSLLLLVTLAAPESLAAHCEGQWAKSKTTNAAKSLSCSKHFLKYAYGKVDKEAMSLDPFYGHAIEKKLSSADLKRMADHLKKACPGESPVESVCVRGVEYFEGMLHRKLSVDDGVNLGSFQPQLAKVLAGKALTDADLYGDNPDLHWSALTLWKLRNAAYARHGYLFKNPDLNAFFYGKRKTAVAGLPLPEGKTKDVKLSAIDGANVKLIKRYEGMLKRK